MRIGFGFILLFTSVAFAQRGGNGVGVVVFPGPGTGLPGVTRSLGSVVNPAQGGLRVPGTGGFGAGFGGGFAGGFGGGFSNRNGGAGFPIIVGGISYVPYLTPTDGSAAPPPEPPPPPAPANVTVVMPPQQAATPVVINYNYGPMQPPPGPEQTGARAPAPASEDNVESSHYLIAFKDHTIYAVSAYWVDGDTLHYFTSGNVHNQASLALVDREFTQRLNKEAGLDVKIPAPK
jgi:hypothetical protein